LPDTRSPKSSTHYDLGNQGVDRQTPLVRSIAAYTSLGKLSSRCRSPARMRLLAQWPAAGHRGARADALSLQCLYWICQSSRMGYNICYSVTLPCGFVYQLWKIAPPCAVDNLLNGGESFSCFSLASLVVTKIDPWSAPGKYVVTL
jgi:hypothetical protein